MGLRRWATDARVVCASLALTTTVTLGAASLVLWQQSRHSATSQTPALAGAAKIAQGDGFATAPPLNATRDAAAHAAARLQPTDTLELSGLQSKFETVARAVGRSVVAISASIEPIDSSFAQRSDDLTPARLQSLLDHTTRIVGTGFVIDDAGDILTNEHVVAEAMQLWITTDDRKVFPAIIMGSDPRADLAVLRIPVCDLPPVRFAPPDSVRRGQWTIALGNPYGLAADGQMCMSVGIVSATHRSLPRLASRENRLYDDLIQTTAEINPGNSGGPLFDLDGNVIGINTAVILPQKQTAGIGFALPVCDDLDRVIAALKQGQVVRYGYLGVGVVPPTAQQLRQVGLGDEVGASVDSVEPHTAAASALHVDDLLVRFNGQPIRSSDQFVHLVGDAPVGSTARIRLFRDGKPQTVQVTIAQRQLPAVAVTRQSRRLRWRGMLLGNIPANWTTPAGRHLESGVLVLSVQQNSPAALQRITEGSVLSMVAGKAVRDIVALQQIINDTPSEQCSIQVIGATQTALVSINGN